MDTPELRGGGGGGGGVFVITSGIVIKNIFTGDIYCIARFFC